MQRRGVYGYVETNLGSCAGARGFERLGFVEELVELLGGDLVVWRGYVMLLFGRVDSGESAPRWRPMPSVRATTRRTSSGVIACAARLAIVVSENRRAAISMRGTVAV
ncbi:MAG: hypothetical protein ACR2KV_10355 [Solirubrobacteraceae bacterium]